METPGPIPQSFVNTPVPQQLVGNELCAYRPSESVPLNSAETIQMISNQDYAVHQLTPVTRLVYSSILPSQSPAVVTDGRNLILQNYMPLANQFINRNINLCGSCGGRRTSSLVFPNPKRKFIEMCRTAEIATQTDTVLTQNMLVNSETNTSPSYSEIQAETSLNSLTSGKIEKQKVTSEAQTDKSFSRFSEMKFTSSPEVLTQLVNHQDLEKDNPNKTNHLSDNKLLEIPSEFNAEEIESQQYIQSSVLPMSSTIITSSSNVVQTEVSNSSLTPVFANVVTSSVNDSTNRPSLHEVSFGSDIDSEAAKSLPPSLLEETEYSIEQSVINSPSDLKLTGGQSLNLQENEDKINSLSPPYLEPMIEPDSQLIMDIPETSIEAEYSLQQTSEQQFSGSIVENHSSVVDKGKASLQCSLQSRTKSISTPQENTVNTFTETDSINLLPITVKKSSQKKKGKHIQKAFIKPQRLILPADVKEKNFVILSSKQNLPLGTIDSSGKIEKYKSGHNLRKKKLYHNRGTEELMQCEFCEQLKPKYRFKQNERFCSISCAVRYNVCNVVPANQSVKQFVENSEKVLEAKKKGKALRCEACGISGLPETFTKSERFCSRSCALRFHRCCFKHVGLSHQEYITQFAAVTRTELKKLYPKIRYRNKKDTNEAAEDNKESTLDTTDLKSSNNIVDSSSSKIDMSSECSTSVDEDIEIIEIVNKGQPKIIQLINLFENDPSKWNVQEVSEFLVKAGCSDSVEKFQFNEIDGQALFMLELHHLMDMMDMKLGSAVKLLNNIKMLKEKLDEDKNIENEQKSI